MNSLSLTPTDLMAAASGYLTAAEYAQVGPQRLDGLNTNGGRFFEDRYSIVMLVVYDTWRELGQLWMEAQASLVELISDNLTRAESKSWDGYLVLLTADPCPASRRAEIDTIRYDTFRVRKLVAAGDELNSLLEVEQALLPLLPMKGQHAAAEQGSVLDLLPGILANHGIAGEASKRLVRAFREQESLLEALHEMDDG
jgi:hypothetical protein